MKLGVLAAITVLLVVPATAKYSGGSGTAQDPYQIATAADLIALGETPTDYGKHFILTADIDLDPSLPGRKVFDKAVIAPDTDQEHDWFQGTSFGGVFDGNGHTISHLTIKGNDCLGLFGSLDVAGEVRHLGIADVNITGSGSDVGGLVGWSWGTVTQCYSTGAVSGNSCVGGLVGYNCGGILMQCYSTDSVEGFGTVGGLVGYNEGGTVMQCYSAGAVEGFGTLGGLVGENSAVVIQCYNTSRVNGGGDGVGGLVGYNWGAVIDCYSSGAVSGSEYAGGLVGKDWDGYFEASFWDTQSSGQKVSAGGTGKTTAEMHDPNTFRAAGWDFVGQADGPSDIWAMPPGGGYPILWWQLSPWPSLPTFSGGTGEPNDPYRISTAKDLNSIGDNPRLMKCHFKLVADLDLTGVLFYPIGSGNYAYGGVFDGLGHAISHLTINGMGCVGLFRVLGSGAEVKNLGVVDVNVVSSGSYVGGLVGYNSRGTVTRCYSTGAVRGVWEVGGLVGDNSGGTVSQCYSTGRVGAESVGGGLVGGNHGRVAECYSTGTVSGTSSVGGLVGSGDAKKVTACFWDTQSSGQKVSAGGTGKTTAQMQTAKTFLDAGWDFVGETKNGTADIWWILEGKDYPRLWWEQK